MMYLSSINLSINLSKCQLFYILIYCPHFQYLIPSAWIYHFLENLIKNPSFIALQWNGDVGSQIDHRPWTIESNNGGYLLEKKPIGKDYWIESKMIVSTHQVCNFSVVFSG